MTVTVVPVPVILTLPHVRPPKARVPLVSVQFTVELAPLKVKFVVVVNVTPSPMVEVPSVIERVLVPVPVNLPLML